MAEDFKRDVQAILRKYALLELSDAQTGELLAFDDDLQMEMEMWGMETEARGILLDTIALFLIGEEWPLNGDEGGLEFMQRFYAAAQTKGYTLLADARDFVNVPERAA